MRRAMIALLAAGLVLMPGCGDASGNAPQDVKRSPVGVTVVSVDERSDPVEVRRSATLLSRVDVQLVTESSGIVQSRPIPAGTRVPKDAVIVKLSDAAERAALKAARARLSGLAEEGVSLAERQAAESAVEQAAETLRRRTVIAPADGIIDRYDIEEGDHAVSGTAVGRLVDPTKLWLVATVLEDEILGVAPGSRVWLEVPAWPDVRFNGTVLRRGSAALPGSGQFEVEIEVDTDEKLLPGFVATVGIPVKGTEPRRLVPRDAVFQRHGTWRLFTVREDDGTPRAEERTVRIRSVPGRPDLADITHGVEAGTTVVVRGRLGLVDGDPLRILDR